MGRSQFNFRVWRGVGKCRPLCAFSRVKEIANKIGVYHNGLLYKSINPADFEGGEKMWALCPAR